MTARLLLALIASLVVSVAVVLQTVVVPLLPQRIHVRWSLAVSDDRRVRLEQELALTQGTYREQRTWSYVLRDRSPGHIERIIRHPSVEDTHYIDVDALTLTPDDGDRPAWMQAVARSPLFQRAAPWLPAIAIVVGAAGFIAFLPLLRQPGRWLQRHAIAVGRSARVQTAQLTHRCREVAFTSRRWRSSC